MIFSLLFFREIIRVGDKIWWYRLLYSTTEQPFRASYSPEFFISKDVSRCLSTPPLISALQYSWLTTKVHLSRTKWRVGREAIWEIPDEITRPALLFYQPKRRRRRPTGNINQIGIVGRATTTAPSRVGAGQCPSRKFNIKPLRKLFVS